MLARKIASAIFQLADCLLALEEACGQVLRGARGLIVTDQVHRALRIKQIQAHRGEVTKGAGWSAGLGSALAKRRLLIVLGIGSLLTMTEMLDHYAPGNASLFEPEFWQKLPIYALVVPLIAWILLEGIDRGEKRLDDTVRQMDRLASLRIELMEATSWEGLVETIVQFPRHVVPATGVALFVFNEARTRFELTNRWSSDEANKPSFPSAISLDGCSGCLAAQSSAKYDIRLCPDPGIEETRGICARYCAPLVYRGKLTALLHVDLSPDLALSIYQADTLTCALSPMTLAITNARLERFLADQVEAASEAASLERQRIAQDLHDSLAQNIGYLRLKLDQFSSETMLHEITELQRELERMRDTATEAYEQIRGTMIALDPFCQDDLAETLRKRAIYVGERAGFAVILESQPDCYPLAPEVRRQILFICQEALNNVEQHARARVVTIQVDWGQKDLTLSIADDGHGFDRDEVPADGHLGLAIMNQRARSIGGKLAFDSAIGSGTRVTLRFPITAS